MSMETRFIVGRFSNEEEIESSASSAGFFYFLVLISFDLI